MESKFKKTHSGSAVENFGFLAQDVERLVPNLVRTTTSGEDGIEGRGRKAVLYNDFIALLVLAMQARIREIDALALSTTTAIQVVDTKVTGLEERLQLTDKRLSDAVELTDKRLSDAVQLTDKRLSDVVREHGDRIHALEDDGSR